MYLEKFHYSTFSDLTVEVGGHRPLYLLQGFFFYSSPHYHYKPVNFYEHFINNCVFCGAIFRIPCTIFRNVYTFLFQRYILLDLSTHDYCPHKKTL